VPAIDRKSQTTAPAHVFLTAEKEGYYWVCWNGTEGPPCISYWDGDDWWFCGSEVSLGRVVWKAGDPECVIMSGPLEVPSWNPGEKPNAE